MSDNLGFYFTKLLYNKKAYFLKIRGSLINRRVFSGWQTIFAKNELLVNLHLKADFFNSEDGFMRV